ncbi:MAG: 2OG-Fe(II) oxygenase [Microthrixaceae bacterium]
MAEPLAERPLLPRPAAAPYVTHELYLDVFSPAQCRRIIELGSSLPPDDGGVEGSDGVALDSTLRENAVSWIPPEPGTEWVFRKLATIAQRANRRYRFDLTGFEEDLQFTTYERPGAFYTWHQDGLDGPVAHRKLSLVVQLSDPDDYDGAELELFQVHADYDDEDLATFRVQSAARGTVVVFPSLEYHRVTPLRRGTRHSLVSWVSGPPFR